MPKRKLEGRYVCKCECGGQVRGIKDFGRLFTWCEKCTPVENGAKEWNARNAFQKDCDGPVSN